MVKLIYGHLASSISLGRIVYSLLWQGCVQGMMKRPFIQHVVYPTQSVMKLLPNSISG